MKAIFGLLILFAIVWIWSTLARKAGYEAKKSVLMGIGMVVPLVNLGILLYFVLATWPIQAELTSLRGKAGVGSGDDARALLSAALRLETQGQVCAAITKYEEVVQRFPGTEPAKDADASIRSLRAKIG